MVTPEKARSTHKRIYNEDRAAAEKIFPGRDYHGALQLIHVCSRPTRYLEIGVRTGKSLKYASESSFCVGVDPEPHLEGRCPFADIFVETSDAFFARPDVLEFFGGNSIDMTFIDGLHTYDQVLRDFINVERLCAPNSLIVLHDVRPLNNRVASRKQASIFWTGDVWKVLPILIQSRPDLSITYVPCMPSGLLLITRLDPSSTVLNSQYESLVASFADVEFEDAGLSVLEAIEWCANTETEIGNYALRLYRERTPSV